MKKYIFLSVILFSWILGQAQHFNNYTNHWFLSENGGIDFNYNPPQVDTSWVVNSVPYQNSIYVTYNSISDINGNLLFYSDGYYVYNRFHQRMPNGFALNGGDSNSTNGLIGYRIKYRLIFPMPGSTNKYYLIMGSDDHTDSINEQILTYSIIDMSLENGKGDVLIKNQLLLDSCSMKINVIKHTNGFCYWIIGHRSRSDALYAIPVCGDITNETVQPIITHIGINTNFNPPNYPLNYNLDNGMIGISANGRKVYVGSAHVIGKDTLNELFDFDASTGVFSNYMVIQEDQYMLHQFSQDGSKLYIGSGGPNSYMYQFDLSSNNEQAINNSKTIVCYPTQVIHPGGEPRTFSGMHLAPNGKIYISNFYNFVWNSYYLDVINQPDSLGNACGYQDSGFYNQAGHRVLNIRHVWHVQSFLQKPMDFEHIGACVGDTVRFSLSDSVYTVLWDFGDTANPASNGSTLYKPTHVYSQPGSYLVEAACLHYGMHDTVRKVVDIYPLTQVTLGPDVKIDSVSSVTLDAGSGYGGYLWSTGDTSQTLTVNGSGMATGVYPYSIMVTDSGVCPGYDTVLVYVNTWVSLQEPNPEQSWEVFPNPAKDRLMVQIGANWSGCDAAIYNAQGQVVHNQILQNSTTSISLVNLSSGVYYLRLSNDKRSEVKRFEIMW
ncbi:MAG: T9SS type A sorting domain-containing protein [Bacteroidales bacterium]|nr:T9SS type A sorting domain-containing protein [Bacteroidales bacterium]